MVAVNYSVHCIVSVVRLFSKLSISYERILYVTLGPRGSEVLRGHPLVAITLYF